MREIASASLDCLNNSPTPSLSPGFFAFLVVAVFMPLHAVDAKTEAATLRVAYEKKISKHPQDASLLLQYGEFLWLQGEPNPAREQLLKSLKLQPANAPAYSILSMIAQDMGDMQSCMRYLEKVIEYEPMGAQMFFHLGNIYYLFRHDTKALYGWDSTRSIQEAMLLFKRARDLEPDNYRYATGYAEGFYGMKSPDWKSAEEAWLYCLPMAQDRDTVYGHLSRAAIAQKAWKRAEEYLENVTSPYGKRLRERVAEGRSREMSQGDALALENPKP